MRVVALICLIMCLVSSALSAKRNLQTYTIIPKLTGRSITVTAEALARLEAQLLAARRQQDQLRLINEERRRRQDEEDRLRRRAEDERRRQVDYARRMAEEARRQSTKPNATTTSG